MSKEEVLALVAEKKAAAGIVFDEIAVAVGSIEVSVSDEALKAELEAAKVELGAVKAELEALKAQDVIEDADFEVVKAQLQDILVKFEKDEQAIAKFKAILAELAV